MICLTREENSVSRRFYSGDSFSTNPIGAEVISLLKENKTPADIRKTLLDKYDTDSMTLEKDLDDFISLLKEYNWTGNIRELRNVVERLVILSGSNITAADVRQYVVPR